MKPGRNFPRTKKMVRPGKICTRYQTGRQRPRIKPLEAKTNLAPLIAHSGRHRNKIKQMVQSGWLLNSTNILTPLLQLIPLRRLCWKNWQGPMPPSPPPAPNCRPLWISSLRPTINSLVGWATVKAIKTPVPERILRPALRLCSPIAR